MKKIGLLFVTIIMMMLFAVSASAETEGYYTYEVENGEATITRVDTSISGDITIPSILGDYSVTSIGDEAFAFCKSLTSITIPDNVTSIGISAFAGCTGLTSITIPDGVTSIGDEAFAFCKSLTSITIPDNVTSIGISAFAECTGLTSITIPDSVTSIAEGAFRGTGYYNDSSNWENGVLYIGKHLIEVLDVISGDYSIKNGTLVIADSVFGGYHNLTSITIPNTVTSIGDYAFAGGDSLTSITVDESNKHFSSLDGVLFNKDKTKLIRCPIGNNRDSYSIPDSVTTIDKGAFSGCSNLTSVIIPDSVISIGDQAFMTGGSLVSIVVNKGNKNYCSLDGVLFNKDKTELLQYPTGNVRDSYIIPDGVEKIGMAAFSGSKNLVNIIIPDTVVSFGPAAFGSCVNLESVVIPESMSIINNATFFGCNSLKKVVIPSSVTKISDNAFLQCFNIEAIYFCGSESQWNEIEHGMNSGLNVKATVYSHNHEYTHQATTQPTHQAVGVKTFVCNCGKTYFEYIEKIPHSYDKVVTAPTCTEKGYTTYTCACGYSYVDNYINANGHSHTSEITTPATHLNEGVETFTCHCGDTYTKPVAMIPHAYSEVRVEPTCAERGYITYTCECGHSYVDYIGTKPHNYTSVITRSATHLSEGIRTYTCSACGDSYPEAIAKTTEHSYVASDVVAPSCKDKGYTVYVCECGDNYKDNYTSEKGHTYDGQTCTSCGKKCSCNCHKKGISNFFWKISNFFNKLFKNKNKRFCACGIAHY